MRLSKESEGMEEDVLESPPFGRVPLKKAGAPTYPYDILLSLHLQSQRTKAGEETNETKNTVSENTSNRILISLLSHTNFGVSHTVAKE